MPSKTRLDLDNWLGFNPDYLSVFEDKLFLEGTLTGRRLTNFFALLLFAIIIATYGILSDASATVIGAMLVAPLMTPVIGTAAAVVMGSERRALRSLALTAAGVASVIFIAFLLTWVVPDITISFTENEEISSRINPGLYALVTALGAGAAGAYISSRAELSDSIGGVAIAIALVPPLCVVGISLQECQWDAATGAFLLFLTNYMAALLAGASVLVVVGLDKQSLKPEQVRVRSRGFRMFVLGTLLVIVPLTWTAITGFKSLKDDSIATIEVQKWLEGTSYEVVSADVNGDTVNASVEGTGDLNSLQQLENQLSMALGHPVTLDLHLILTLMSDDNVP